LKPNAPNIECQLELPQKKTSRPEGDLKILMLGRFCHPYMITAIGFWIFSFLGGEKIKNVCCFVGDCYIVLR